MERFESHSDSFLEAELVANVKRFSKERFMNEFAAFVGLDQADSMGSPGRQAAIYAQDKVSETG